MGPSMMYVVALTSGASVVTLMVDAPSRINLRFETRNPGIAGTVTAKVEPSAIVTELVDLPSALSLWI